MPKKAVIIEPVKKSSDKASSNIKHEIIEEAQILWCIKIKKGKTLDILLKKITEALYT